MYATLTGMIMDNNKGKSLFLSYSLWVHKEYHLCKIPMALL